MTYTKPQVLNVKRASGAIMSTGKKHELSQDSESNVSSISAYQSDE